MSDFALNFSRTYEADIFWSSFVFLREFSCRSSLDRPKPGRENTAPPGLTHLVFPACYLSLLIENRLMEAL
jgi:hypothetical protein